MKYLNAKGNALLITIFAIVLMSVIGLSLFTITANSNKTTVNERFDQSLYYIAEAGVNLEKAKLAKEIKKAHNDVIAQLNNLQTPEEQAAFNFEQEFQNRAQQIVCANPAQANCIPATSEYKHFEKQFNKQPVAKTKIELSCAGNDCKFTINSDGSFEDSPSKKRALSQELLISLNKPTPVTQGTPGNNDSTNPPFNLNEMAAVITGNISGGGNAKLIGDYGSNSNINLALKSNNLNGSEREIPANIDLNKYLPEKPNLTKPTNNATIVKGKNKSPDTLTLTKDSYLSKLTIKNDNENLTINVGNKNVILYVDDLDVKGNITINGTGTLTLIVKNSFNLSGSIDNLNEGPEKLNLYYAGNSSFDITSNNTKFDGSLFIENADAKINGGAVTGNIYSYATDETTITFSGGSDVSTPKYIVAPNATIDSQGNAVVNGTVLAKELDMTGNFTLNLSGNPSIPIPNPNPGTPSKYAPSDNFLDELPMDEI